MISEQSLEKISTIVCGDVHDFYPYKTGPNLVAFFNSFLGESDTYGQGFPSRWYYTLGKIKRIIDKGNIDEFLNLILSKNYMIKEHNCSEVEAIERSEETLTEFNSILRTDRHKIIHRGNGFHLIEFDEDLVLIGSGGFADVYHQISTGRVVKKLKDELIPDDSNRSRFRREYNITLSLQDIPGIIRVYDFDEDNCSYTMEYLEHTLECCINENDYSLQEKQGIIRDLFEVMSEVHDRDVIHRDLSPNNVFYSNNGIVIADFGLGKEEHREYSHQTMYTNVVGQYNYCAPEQFRRLKDASKRSDVFSLGRILNFIMTRDPGNSHHLFSEISYRATHDNPEHRFADARQMMDAFDIIAKHRASQEYETQIEQKIGVKLWDKDVERYIFELTNKQLCAKIRNKIEKFQVALLWFMSDSEEKANYIISSIETTYKEVCGTYEVYDPFAVFAYKVIQGNYSFQVKDIACIMLHYIAWEVNRFSARDLIRNLINNGVEPLLEGVLKK